MFNGQTLIISKDSTLKINNGHKKGKDLTYYILAYKAIIFLRIFDLQGLQYVKLYKLCINDVSFGIIIILKVFLFYYNDNNTEYIGKFS